MTKMATHVTFRSMVRCLVEAKSSGLKTIYANPTCRKYAGHNKWSQIKHKKHSADLNRSKVIGKLSAEIQNAALVGGLDPDYNLKLSWTLARARKEGKLSPPCQ